MLRLSSLLLAAAVFVPAVASARRVHSAVSNVATVAAPAAPVAEVAEAAADSEQLGFSGKCAAKCAIDAAMCVHGCGKKSSLEAAQLTLTCKEECALKATACAAKCVLSADVSLPAVEGVESDLIDGSNIEAAFAEINNSPDALMLGQFQSFKAQFGKKYASEEVEAHRFELFKQNMARAEELNKLNPTAKFGVTQFSDLHPSEFKRQYLTYRPAVGDSAVLRKAAPVMEASNVSAVPDNWDWRRPSDGRPVGVTAVKDQGQCGSCWAFSATEATESAWILAGNSPQILAPEQTVDCDTTDGGCNGGDTVTAYAYIKQTGGIMAESAYPYKAGVTGVAGKCKFERSGVKASIKGFEYATPGCDDECDKQNEEQLKENLYKVGPVSICVDAEPWQMYQSGILGTGSGCTKAYDTMDHCVQLVGYGVDAATKEAFWSVRNSWATSWGEAGYIRLKYGVNLCGVADEATIVQV